MGIRTASKPRAMTGGHNKRVCHTERNERSECSRVYLMIGIRSTRYRSVGMTFLCHYEARSDEVIC